MPNKTNYCIALQSICDSQFKHVADELLYRGDPKLNMANVDNTNMSAAYMATARACNVAFYETGIKKLVGNRKLFVNMPRDWLLMPDLLPPEPDKVVIEVLETVTGEPEVIESLKRIKEKGYQISLDDFVLNSKTEPLLEVADIIKVDMLEPYYPKDIEEYRARGKTLLAEKVETLEMFEELKAEGFKLFQGYFYARPEIIQSTSRGRTTNYRVILQILAELQNNDVDHKDIQTLIEQDPELAFSILKCANSISYRRSRYVLNIFEAIYLLGVRQIRTIALTILFANNGPVNRLLLSRVLRRAYMCEILSTNVLSADEAFVVGLMSMMDIMLGKPLEELLKQLSFSEELTEAILEYKHPLGRLLKSIKDFENSNVQSWPTHIVERYNQAYILSQARTNRVLLMVDSL